MRRNDQFVNDLHPLANKLSHIEEEVEVVKEEDDEDEEVKDEEENDDAYLWNDPFLDRPNLKMEIQDDGGFKMVQGPEGGSGVADEGSIPDVTLPE